MSLWKIRRKVSKVKQFHPFISKSARVHPRAGIYGKVFVSDETSIGRCIISASGDFNIYVGGGTVLKDHVLVATDISKCSICPNETQHTLSDIYIGSMVFISSDVSICGHSVISDKTFIGNNSTIVNSKIGAGCVIEDHVIIKNVEVPPDIFILHHTVVDSLEKLNEVVKESRENSHCQAYFSSRDKVLLEVV